MRSSVGDSANGASLKEENCKMMHLQSIYDYIILAYDDVGVDVMKLCHAHVTIPFICHSLNASAIFRRVNCTQKSG